MKNCKIYHMIVFHDLRDKHKPKIYRFIRRIEIHYNK
jgi:hypothetical protein